MSQAEFLKRLIEIFGQAEIPYMLVGSMASAPTIGTGRPVESRRPGCRSSREDLSGQLTSTTGACSTFGSTP